jgi:hypothetical protein
VGQPLHPGRQIPGSLAEEGEHGGHQHELDLTDDRGLESFALGGVDRGDDLADRLLSA